MNKPIFTFDLQLFAEEIPETAEQNNAAVEQDGMDTTQTEPANDLPEGSIKITVDPNTGKRSIVSAYQQQEESVEGGEEEKANDTTDNTEEVPSVAPYSVEELVLAAQLGQVDESRIPDTYKTQYAAYKQQMSMQQRQSTQTQEQPAQENQPVSPQEQYELLNKLAVERTLKELGMTAEELETLRYSEDDGKQQMFNIAVQANANKILLESQQMLMQQQAAAVEQRAIMQDICDFAINKQKEEKNWEAIDTMMGTRYLELPYREAAVVEQAITAFRNGTIRRDQLPVLEKYYSDTRAAFYAKQNNLSTIPQQRNVTKKPPIVESAGGGSDVKETLNPAQMRNMNVRERGEFLAKYFSSLK